MPHHNPDFDIRSERADGADRKYIEVKGLKREWGGAGVPLSARQVLAIVLPILRRALEWADQVWLRIDAGFPEPKLLEALEEEGFLYVVRVKTNAVLERLAAPLLALPRNPIPMAKSGWTHELR